LSRPPSLADPNESVKKTFQKLMTEYGVIAIIVYFSIFFLCWIGSWAAIERGVDLAALAKRVGLSSNRLVASLGAWTAAYLFTKILQPLRLGLTVVLTPLVAKIYERVRPSVSR
jgi:hypothetical protein